MKSVRYGPDTLAKRLWEIYGDAHYFALSDDARILFGRQEAWLVLIRSDPSRVACFVAAFDPKTKKTEISA